MRLLLLLIAPCLAAAATPALKTPHPAPPKIFQMAVPHIAWWNNAERARVASRPPFTIPDNALSKPQQMPLLLPYPYQAPSNGRSYFFLQ